MTATDPGLGSSASPRPSAFLPATDVVIGADVTVGSAPTARPDVFNPPGTVSTATTLGATEAGSSAVRIFPSGDKSGATDTANILTAIANLSSTQYPNQGGSLILARGIWSTNAPITVTSDNITISGDGLGNPIGNKNTNTNPQYGGTVIVPTASFTGSYVLKFGQSGTPTRTLSGCFLRNISIDCQNAPSNVSGIFWQVFKGGGEHVYVSKATGSGFVLDGNGNFVFPNGAWDNHFFDWTSDSATGNGWTLQNSATDNSFVECTSKFCGGDGFNLDSTSTSNRWTGGYIYNCTGKCINSANAFQPKIVGVRMEDSNGGVYLAAAATLGGFLITGCTFRNMSFAGDNLTDAINISASATMVGGMLGANDFAVDQGSGNGTGPNWNRPRYLINLTGGNVTKVVVAPYNVSPAGGNGYFGTSAINDLGTNTTLAWCIGGSGLPELKHSGNVRFLYRAGSPAGAVTANPGSICINTNGGAGATLFVKESANDTSGWVGK